MHRSLAIVILVAFASKATADEPKPKDPAQKGVTLKIGDPAPPLRASKWLKGDEVKEFVAGKTYVIEFWAAWCQPCLAMMPHMGDLNAEYRKQGVTFVAFATKDPNNSLERVQGLVERRGPKLGYAFAYADDARSYDAWMTAAGQGSFPCAFVVDGAGKIAYVGHPMYLGLVLSKVVAGKWAAADRDELKTIEGEVRAVFASFRDPDARVGLSVLAEFENDHPKLTGLPLFDVPRLGLLLKSKQSDAARKLAEELLAKGVCTDDSALLTMVSNAMRSQPAGGDPKMLKLSLTAAEAALKSAGDRDAFALLTVAQAHCANGSTAKAKSFGARAMAAAETEPDATKKYIANEVKTFDDGK